MHATTTKNWKKNKNSKRDMFRSIGKQSGESVKSLLKKKVGYGGKDLHKSLE